MIAVDTNLLVYSVREDAPRHRAALRCIRKLAEGPAAWAIPWPCVHEFLAVVSSPRIYKPPMPVHRAVQQVENWLESPGLSLIGESLGYWAHLRHILDTAPVRGGAVHDARIAAICRAAGVTELWTADRDFSRFPGLAIRNPLGD